MKNFLAITLLLVGFKSFCYSQSFTIYAQKERYKLKCMSCIRNYYFLGQNYIDKNKKNIIDLKTLESGINSVIRDYHSRDLIILDIENQIYQDVKKNGNSDINYKKNIGKLVEMIKFTKRMRPTAKVVLYGVPFTFNYDFQKEFNNFDKLKPILEVVDYLSPHLYLMYSDLEKNESYFKNYISSNLNVTFQMAAKVNKPVLPFIWYKIHPYNKVYGGTLVNDALFNKYLEYIKDYRYGNKSVNGIIYWEPARETTNINNTLEKTLKILNK